MGASPFPVVGFGRKSIRASCRCRRVRASEGDGSLILAVGDGRGREWREDPDAGLSLPPGTLPALRDALRTWVEAAGSAADEGIAEQLRSWYPLLGGCNGPCSQLGLECQPSLTARPPVAP